MSWFEIDYDIWKDPQQAKPFCMCAVCGREIYRPMQETCDRCLMDMEDEE
jgi:hypothetical protein